MMSFLCYSQTLILAKFVSIVLLKLKIMFCLMELMPVNIRNTVRKDMTVQMLLILVYRYQALMIRKEPVNKLPSDLEYLFWCYLFILVKTDDVMGVHPAGVFIPQTLFCKPCLIDLIIIYSLTVIRACYLYTCFLKRIIPENILDRISHGSVAVPFVIDDLIDCHTASLSLR